MLQEVEILGRLVRVTVTQLRHGFRADAFVDVAGKRQFFRAKGPSVRAAIADLKADVLRARDAAAIRKMRAEQGLRLVASN